MRVAVVTESFVPHPDAVAITVKHVVDRLLDSAHDVLVIAPGPGVASYRGARIARTRTVPGPGIVSALHAFAPDVVHVSGTSPIGLVGLRAAARLGVPSVLLVHDTVGRGLGQVWGSRVRPHATRTLVTCSDARERLAKIGGGAQVWAPGVDTDVFHPGMRSEQLHACWSRQSSPAGARVVVGHVGSLDKDKVVARLTDVAAVPGTRLVVIGDGRQAGRLRAQVPSVKITGHLHGNDLTHAVASLDVLVAPRKKELSAHGLRQALACGVPAVVIDAGAARDLVRHGENGLAGPIGTLAPNVARLVAEPGLRTDLAAHARASLPSRSWADAVDELVAIHYAGAAAAGRVLAS